ncbi:uncharacterized protein BT62DRAFT_931546 [Guyanagaster necrorhizus]|uniref:F-box domain-containing protein n=1 Tax=Guyanagaster necrorhizus TaxID=856835 RepID=A0A9P8AT16_9AGAR|nr:uncharacterized protein BT62DRAFT_931546 [Guyanagaster necrorhizus MCA 3950]KAG7446973.1 hypothetical protein BT62DRAFT_931546 [Guyanagaster necrorhizus MCA 3950]
MVPAELMDVILDYLRDDPSTLKTCSLVSKYWLQSSRRHYFRAVVTALNQYKFVELCANTNAFIPQTLHDVYLVLEPQLETEAFSRTLPVLQNTTSLYVKFAKWEPSLSTLSAKFPGITNLRLDKIIFDSLSHALDFITSFPLLQSLSIHDTSWPDPHEDIRPPPISLTYLTLSDCCQRDIFDRLCSLEPIPLIPHIDLGYSVRPADTRSIGTYLSHLGEALQTLTFGFWSFDAGGDAEDFYLSADLGLNASLRRLRVDYFISNMEVSQVTSAGPWIVKMLHRLNPAALENVDLGISPWSGDELDTEDDSIDWVDLDQLFSGRLSGARLRFLVYGYAVFEQICEGLKDRLATCSQRGNLLIERCRQPISRLHISHR